MKIHTNELKFVCVNVLVSLNESWEKLPGKICVNFENIPYSPINMY